MYEVVFFQTATFDTNSNAVEEWFLRPFISHSILNGIENLLLQITSERPPSNECERSGQI